MDDSWSKGSPRGADGYVMQPSLGEESSPRFKTFIEGFKRDPHSEFYSREYTHGTVHPTLGPYYDLRNATKDNAQTGGLMRRLKGRHLQMIAIGGSVGMY